MGQPAGLGMWIAFPSMLGGYPMIVDRLRACGVQWVAPRAGEGSKRDPSFTSKDIELLRRAGLAVYPWIFSRPASWQGEVQLFREIVDEGADGVIIDAEVAWELNGDHHDAAARYMDALDAALPKDTFVADAPWPYPSYHAKFPFAEFGRRVNARMPQGYWTENGKQSAAFRLPQYDAEWERWNAAHPDVVRPVWNIGITYGAKEMKKWGAKQLPPGEITPEDVNVFLDRYPTLPISLYSFEAASPEVLEALMDRAPRIDPPRDAQQSPPRRSPSQDDLAFLARKLEPA